jgi:hypothetical protein
VTLPKRWVYLVANPANPARVEAASAVMRRAAAAGYNGIVLAGWDRIDQTESAFVDGVARLRAVAAELRLDIVPAVFAIGDSRGLLARDPNLAEALPVRGALFVVRAGVARLEPDPPVDSRPGVIERLHGGESASISRTISVSPFRQYHVRAEVKSEAANGRAKIAISAGKRALVFVETDVAPAQGWIEAHAAFNSLDNLTIELGFGCTRCRPGELRWRNPIVEEVGLLNVVRRDAAPLEVRREAGAVLEEGRDYERITDPWLASAAGRYSAWHEPPVIRAPHLADGTRLRVSYHHAIVFGGGKVMICPSEQKTLEILRAQAVRAHSLWHPRAYWMDHDEIRVLGWDPACTRRRLTPGEIVADDVRQCLRMLRALDPNAEIYVWSDMFDPHHNARPDYYYVNGDLRGSWEGLDRRVTVALWAFDLRDRSLAWFASRSQPMLIAGYYDRDPSALRQWLDSARATPGIRGVMYTTWQDRYDDLERFAQTWKDAD